MINDKSNQQQEKSEGILYLFSKYVLLPIFILGALISFFYPGLQGSLRIILQGGFWIFLVFLAIYALFTHLKQ